MADLAREDLIKLLAKIPVIAPDSAVLRCQLCGDVFITDNWEEHLAHRTFVCAECTSEDETAGATQDRLRKQLGRYCEDCGEKIEPASTNRTAVRFCREVDEEELQKVRSSDQVFTHKGGFGLVWLCRRCFRENLLGRGDRRMDYVRFLSRWRYFDDIETEELSDIFTEFEWIRLAYLERQPEEQLEAFAIEPPDWTLSTYEERDLHEFWPWSKAGLEADPRLILFPEVTQPGVAEEERDKQLAPEQICRDRIHGLE